MENLPISTGERLEKIWQYIANSFEDIPIQFGFLLDFVAEHEICWYIAACFLISAAVIIFKRLVSTMGH